MNKRRIQTTETRAEDSAAKRHESAGASLRAATNASAGFSLVEVCLAILVVALGLLAVFGLFPGGLRSSENAAGDTVAALFAENVLCGVEANSTTITNWSDWQNIALFKAKVLPAGFYPAVAPTGLGAAYNTINFPDGAETWVRYKLDVTNRVSGSTRLGSATLYVYPGKYGATANPEIFYTEFFCYGM